MATEAALKYLITASDERFNRVMTRVEKRLGTLERRGDRSARSMRRLSSTISGTLTPALAGLVSAGGLALLSRRLIQSGLSLERLNQRFTFAAGSIAKGREQMAFVRREARRLGIDFDAAADSFSKFAAAARGTNLSEGDIREIFLGVAESARVMGLTAEQTEGAMRALEQMMSKGRVQAEELRGQLGERLPGAFQLAADAMGVTTAELNKMLERGEVASDVFLPKFARALRENVKDAVPAATESAAASFERLGNAIDAAGKRIGASLLEPLSRVADVLARIIGGIGSLGEFDYGQAKERARAYYRGRGQSPALADQLTPEELRQHFGPDSGRGGLEVTVTRGRVAPAPGAGTTASGRGFGNVQGQMLQRRDALRRIEEAEQRRQERSREYISQLADLELEVHNAQLARIAERAAAEEAQAKQAHENLTEAIAGFIKGTGDLKSAINGFLTSVANNIIEQFASAAAGRLLSGFGGGLLSSIFGGGLFGFAEGGSARRGRAIVVGERGPELFVPGTSGHVVPNHAIAGGGGMMGGPTVNLTFNIESTDGPGVRAALDEATPQLTRAALTALAQQQARPGTVLGRQNRQAL